jgi:hypothetical protein
MGKNKCCKKSSSLRCDETSSCYSSSSTYGFCCPKYPKCCCVKDKCAPIYYPNNCVGQYPCNPCPPPCPPYPCPPYPCPPTQCGPKYTSSNTKTTTSSALSISTPNVLICDPSADITLTLPAISTLSSCSYTKMFVISNVSINAVTVSPTAPDSLTNSGITLNQGDCVTLYSVYMSTGSYWVVA